jgi:hypothetical protein
MQIEASFFFSSPDPSGSRSTPTNGSSSFLCNCGPSTTKGARPRTCDTLGARSPAAREYESGGGAWRVMRAPPREREREKCAVKIGSEGVTAR